MSFLSNLNRFAEFSVVPTPEKVGRSQTHSYQAERPPSLQPSEFKAFNDSFDEIVLRNTPNLCGKNFLNRLGDESPTGVMDFVSKLQHQQEEETGDALAFVDVDEGDHVFTDKEDSFVMKSPEQICTSPIYQPVFLSPNRFEI